MVWYFAIEPKSNRAVWFESKADRAHWMALEAGRFAVSQRDARVVACRATLQFRDYAHYRLVRDKFRAQLKGAR